MEWAYGVSNWFEAGLYMPLYANIPSQGWTYNGFKLRALFVQPDNEDKDFYYGVNFEFSWNKPQWDQFPDHDAATLVALYTCWYNFARINSAVCMSPAMACGLEQRLWGIGDIVMLIEEWELPQ